MYFSVGNNIIADDGVATIEAIRKSTLEYTRAIHSIEYEVKDKDSDTIGHLKYWQQGNMFRAESSIFRLEKWASPAEILNSILSGKSLDGSDTWIAAYNGRKYQTFFKETKSMTLTDTSTIPNPTRILGTPTIAFSWLAKWGMTFTWSELTSENNINAHFQKAKYIGEELVNDEVCNILEFSGVVAKSTIRVWFAKEKSNFPIKSVLNIDGNDVAETVITSFDTVLLDDGNSIVIPTNVTGTSKFNQSKRSTSIVSGTLKVNEKYDEALFTIPTTLVKTVNDTDQLETADLPKPQQNDQILPNNLPDKKRSYFWLIVVNIVVIAFLVYRLLVRKRSR
jgi:hypothetical protein